MGCAPGTVKSQVSAGLKKLRRELDGARDPGPTGHPLNLLEALS